MTDLVALMAAVKHVLTELVAATIGRIFLCVLWVFKFKALIRVHFASEIIYDITFNIL